MEFGSAVGLFEWYSLLFGRVYKRFVFLVLKAEGLRGSTVPVRPYRAMSAMGRCLSIIMPIALLLTICEMLWSVYHIFDNFRELIDGEGKASPIDVKI